MQMKVASLTKVPSGRKQQKQLLQKFRTFSSFWGQNTQIKKRRISFFFKFFYQKKFIQKFERVAELLLTSKGEGAGPGGSSFVTSRCKNVASNFKTAIEFNFTRERQL